MKTFLSCLGCIALVFGLVGALLLSYYLTALLVLNYYNWFIQSVTNWNAMNIYQALGISSLIVYLTHEGYSPTMTALVDYLKKNDDEIAKKITVYGYFNIVAWVIAPLITLAVGYFFHWLWIR